MELVSAAEVAKRFLFAGFLTATSIVGPVADASAQSFFTTLVTDPVVGVDRGSTLALKKVDEATGYAGFDNYGAEGIGPYVASVGYAYPGLVNNSDQVEIVGVLGGPTVDGRQELLAGGIGYRYVLPDESTTLYFNADYGEITIGTEEGLAVGSQGRRESISIGARRIWKLGPTKKLTGVLQFAARSSVAELFNAPVIEEELRLLRGAVLYETGFPLTTQRRFSFAWTRGLPGFGASDPNNSSSSLPGATSVFNRASFSAETSIPLGNGFLTNAGFFGQWTNESLPLSQRCGFGTNAYSRGFDRSFINADRCFGARVEIAHNIEKPKSLKQLASLTQPFAGIDFGRLENVGNHIQEPSRGNWSSASTGIRVLREDWIGEASVTKILSKPDSPIPQDDFRFWVRAAMRF